MRVALRWKGQEIHEDILNLKMNFTFPAVFAYLIPEKEYDFAICLLLHMFTN